MDNFEMVRHELSQEILAALNRTKTRIESMRVGDFLGQVDRFRDLLSSLNGLTFAIQSHTPVSVFYENENTKGKLVLEMAEVHLNPIEDDVDNEIILEDSNYMTDGDRFQV